MRLVKDLAGENITLSGPTVRKKRTSPPSRYVWRSFRSFFRTETAVGAEGQSVRYCGFVHGTSYMRLGLGDSFAGDVAATVRRSTRTASTALITPVSSESTGI